MTHINIGKEDSQLFPRLRRQRHIPTHTLRSQIEVALRMLVTSGMVRVGFGQSVADDFGEIDGFRHHVPAGGHGAYHGTEFHQSHRHGQLYGA